MKRIVFKPLEIWIIINLFAGFFIWRQLQLINGLLADEFFTNLSNFLLFFVVINSLLVILARKYKQSLLAYLANALTSYLLFLIYLYLSYF